MLICLFKLEDIGPKLAQMVIDKSIEFDQNIIDKFSFAGSITYSLVFQGMTSLEEMRSELYGPFPFAFSTGFVQYAFSFLVQDDTIQDQRMQNKTLGLLLMLVPEIVSKIEDFREELAKIVFYKFRNITHIRQVDNKLLTEIIEEYNAICTRLLNEKLARELSEQLIDMIKSVGHETEEKTSHLTIVYHDEYETMIKSLYTSLLASLPYEETNYKEDVSIIKTANLELRMFDEKIISSSDIAKTDGLFFVLNITKPFTEKIISLLAEYKTGKIGIVINLPADLEKGSKLYAKFFEQIQQYLGEHPFFSANFSSISEFKHKMLEALLWGLSPVE